MFLYLDRPRSAMIYPLDRSCLGHMVQNLQYNPNIDKQIIHNLAHILTGIDHVLDIPRVI